MIKYGSPKVKNIKYYHQTGVLEFPKPHHDIISSYCNEQFPFFLYDDTNNPFKVEGKYKLRVINALE